MNVLFISGDQGVFDAESPVRARMQSYAAAIGTLHVLVRVDRGVQGQPSEIQEGGLHIHGVHGNKLSALLRMKDSARSLIAREGIEIVSAQDPFEYGWVAREAVRGTQVKLHLQIHTDFCSRWFVEGKALRATGVRMPFLNRIRMRIADRVLPEADGIRVVSDRIKQSLTERYGDRTPPVTIIPVAVTPTIPERVPLPEVPFSFALIMVARLEPEKRIIDAIDALARVARTYPMVGLMIVGEGRSRAALEQHARRLGLAPRVVFLGWRTDAVGLMRSAQAYLQTSAYEGYGLTLIEAALARVPIITTDVGIVGEVFTGYEDVLVAPVADPAAIAVHIAGLVEDVQARTLLAMHAEQKARAHLAQLVDQPAQVAQNLAQTIAGISV